MNDKTLVAKLAEADLVVQALRREVEELSRQNTKLQNKIGQLQRRLFAQHGKDQAKSADTDGDNAVAE